MSEENNNQQQENENLDQEELAKQWEEALKQQQEQAQEQQEETTPEDQEELAKQWEEALKQQSQEENQGTSTEEDLNLPKDEKLELLLDIPLEISVEIGGRNLPLEDLLKLNPNTVFELDRYIDEPIDIKINGKPIAKGELYTVENNFGIKITSIITVEERIKLLLEKGGKF